MVCLKFESWFNLKEILLERKREREREREFTKSDAVESLDVKMLVRVR